MAFNVYFKAVVNEPNVFTNANPWRCNKCNKKDVVLVRGKIDYDTLILCKGCLKDIMELIEEEEKNYADKGDL